MRVRTRRHTHTHTYVSGNAQPWLFLSQRDLWKGKSARRLWWRIKLFIVARRFPLVLRPSLRRSHLFVSWKRARILLSNSRALNLTASRNLCGKRQNDNRRTGAQFFDRDLLEYVFFFEEKIEWNPKTTKFCTQTLLYAALTVKYSKTKSFLM